LTDCREVLVAFLKINNHMTALGNKIVAVALKKTPDERRKGSFACGLVMGTLVYALLARSSLVSAFIYVWSYT